MKYEIVLSPKATIALVQSIDWYNKRKTGLGKRFFSKVKSTIKTISKNPYLFELKYNDFRCIPVDVFPFVIMYTIIKENKVIIISAIFHTSRNPDELEKS